MNIEFKSIIHSQDTTMQYQMEQALRKYVKSHIDIINYSTHSVRIIEKDGKLEYNEKNWKCRRWIIISH